MAGVVPWLVIDGWHVEGEKYDSFSRFIVPPKPNEIVIRSEAKQPNRVDHRLLGVPVTALLIDGGRGRRFIDVDDEAITDGFYHLERSGISRWRWTNGAGRLNPALWSALDGPFHLSVFTLL